MSRSSQTSRGGNVVHRIDLPRRRWPAKGRFVLGWPEGAAPLETPEGQDSSPARTVLRPLREVRPEEVDHYEFEPLELEGSEAGEEGKTRDLDDLAQYLLPFDPNRRPVRDRQPEEDRDRDDAYRAEIERLERRLRKVSDLLDTREEELRKLVEAGRVDTGLASIYREVEGIRDDSPMAETKKDMMSTIFEANRKLQSRLKELERSGGAGTAGEAGGAGAA